MVEYSLLEINILSACYFILGILFCRFILYRKEFKKLEDKCQKEYDEGYEQGIEDGYKDHR